MPGGGSGPPARSTGGGLMGRGVAGEGRWKFQSLWALSISASLGIELTLPATMRRPQLWQDRGRRAPGTPRIRVADCVNSPSSPEADLDCGGAGAVVNVPSLRVSRHGLILPVRTSSACNRPGTVA